MAKKQIKTNKTSEKKTIALDASMPKLGKERKPTYEVRPIENGFIVSKSWTDKDGNYQSTQTYSPENPLEVSIKK